MHTTILQEAASEESRLAFLNYKTEKQHLSQTEEKKVVNKEGIGAKTALSRLKSAPQVVKGIVLRWMSAIISILFRWSHGRDSFFSIIKRKAEALRRWQRGKNLSGEKAAVGFIRAMNRKFYGGAAKEEAGDEFTWNRWFFFNLTVDTGLKEIDAYMQEYIRYTVTGRHYKGNYRIKYETMKKWGYRSLVHEYYEWRKCRAAD